MSRQDLFIGLISGTSMDGVDAALVEFTGGQPRLLQTHTHTYPPDLAERLRELVAGAPTRVAELAALDVQLGQIFAAAARQLLSAAGLAPSGVRALGSHGQTLYHGPDDRPPVSVQLGDPNTIAEITGIDTVADFRRRDLACGGQGAPLAPALHARLFRSAEEDRAVLNLGGIANLTLLPKDAGLAVTGFDTGPGNCLLDAWIREHLGHPYDDRGRWAAAGAPAAGLLARLTEDEYFRRPPPKSTGVETFDLQWLRRRANVDALAPEDVQATLCELTARTVAEALKAAQESTRRLLVCGGGGHNRCLLDRLAAFLPGVPVGPSDDHGLAADWVEAVLFAWLAREAVAGRELDLTATTGASRPHLFGVLYRA